MKRGMKVPPGVKCDSPKCKGANHHPSCSVYQAALVDWIPEKTKRVKPASGHGRKDRPPATKEEMAEIARENGRKGGRPPGSITIMPLAALAHLRKGKFRVRAEVKSDPLLGEAASETAGWALERLAYVAAGKVSSRKAPSVAKAAVAIREEICDPIVKAVQHSGQIDLGKALDAISAPAVPAEEKDE